MARGSGKAKASSWAAAMGVGGTVEALKDQHAGLCRWSHEFRNVQQRAGSATAGNGACGKAKVVPTAGVAAARRKAKQGDEEELRTVMYLSNWGPNN